MIVIKRDGNQVSFEKNKIVKAIEKAYIDCYDDKNCNYAVKVADAIENTCQTKGLKEISVESIQDLVEDFLMEYDKKVAKTYIRYRKTHEIVRNSTDCIILEYLRGENDYWEKENSNKDAKVVTTQRDYLAGITSTDIAKRFLLPLDVVKALRAVIKSVLHSYIHQN